MATHVVLAGSVPAALSSGQLVQWMPTRPLPVQAARLYLATHAQQRMNPAADGRESLRSAAGTAFDRFVQLGSAAHRLFDPSWGKLGVAQLKVLAPKPGTRLIGGFVDPLLFVGLRLYWRDELDFKQTGQVGLINYFTLGQQAAAEWDSLLPDFPRLSMKEF